MLSAAIHSFRYDQKRHQLWVSFVGGRHQLYDRVPQRVHDALLDAPSKAMFFNRFIRDRFPCREVRQAS
jgi:hypothetical protein